MKKITVLFFFLLSVCFTYAQEVTIGTGTITQEYPLSSFFGHQRSAALYTAGEINQTGFINKLAWEIGKTGETRPVKIYLKEVESTTLTTANWPTLTSGATLVYDGSFIPSATGFRSINLDRSFSFTGGTKNLLVLVETNVGGGGIDEAEGLKIKATTSSNKHMVMRVDNSQSTSNLTFVSSRPNVKIEFGNEIMCYGISATINELTATTASFSITEQTTTSSFSYEIRTAGEAGSGSVGLVDSGSVTDLSTLPIVVNGLTQLTNYALYVRANCGTNQASLYSSAILFTTPLAPVALPYTEDFELETGGEDQVYFGFLNDTTNKWYVGNAIQNERGRSLYISNDNGQTNTYTSTGAQVSKAYKDFIIPQGTEDIVISFDWRCVGEGNDTKVDYLNVWLMPTTTVLTKGTAIQTTTTNIKVGTYNANKIFKNERLIINASAFAGENMRLVFEWIQNETLGINPPAAIDNLVVKQYSCKDINLDSIQVTEETSTGGKLSWTSTNAAAYDLFVTESPIEPTEITVPTLNVEQSEGTTANFTTLESGRQYLVWIRSNCGTDDVGGWVGPKILATTMTPVALPYIEDFEGATNFEFKKNDTKNKWFIGSAVNNGGNKALYISENFGASHSYNVEGVQVSHVYKDFIMPTESTGIRLNFDWLALGEKIDTANKDYFRVWATLSSFTPTSGTKIEPGVTTILFEKKEFNNVEEFIAAELSTNTTVFAGQTVRIIFEWIQNETLGEQPPAVIDNLQVRSLNCEAPSNLTKDPFITRGTKIKVDWEGVPGIEDYEVFICTTEDVPSMELEIESEEENGYVALVPVTGLTHTFENLDQRTSYYIWVRSRCDDSSVSIWHGGIVVRTGLIPVELPYYENFELDELEDGEREDNVIFDFTKSSVNNWFIGEGVSRSGDRSLYISKDEGVSNTYNQVVSGGQVSHAFKDFIIPTGATDIAINFDWRCLGEGTATVRNDYFTVWAVPTNFIPTAGTQITATANRIKLGKVAYYGSEVFGNESIIRDLSIFAGEDMRLVFEWRQNNTGGANPPAAIDNLIVKQATCKDIDLSSIQMRNISHVQGTISWTAINAASYDLFVSTSPVGPTYETEATLNVEMPTHTFQNLNAGTQYFVWIRTRCSDQDFGFWSEANILATDMTVAELPYFEDFEGNTNFEFKKNDITNRWYVGDAVHADTIGTKSLYISENLGLSHTYNFNSAQVSHVYKDFSIGEDVSTVKVEFDWMCNGEGFTTSRYDYFKVWVVPASYVPTAGTQITPAADRFQIGNSAYNGSNTFTHASLLFNSIPFIGNNVRLVFEWRQNSTNGANPPAAIDNLQVSAVCTKPDVNTFVYSSMTNTTATVSWMPILGQTQYELFYSTTNTAPGEFPTEVVGSVLVTGTSYTFENLQANTEYFFWIRTVCSEEDKSSWVGDSFFSGQLPAEMPFREDFEGANNWTLISNSVNKWFVGTAVNNGGRNALYISNTNGTSYGYTITSETVAHAYRDINIPADAVEGELKFDWRAFGESNRDYMKVWLVPANTRLNSDIPISSSSDRIQIGTFNLVGGFTNAISEVDLIPFAGSTARLVFEWINNANSGIQPPAAVDNINFVVVPCPSIKNLGACAGEDYINYTWDQQPGRTEWEIVFSETDMGDTPDLADIQVVDEPTYVAENLIINTTYYFYVRNACDNGLKGKWRKVAKRTARISIGEAEPFCAGAAGIVFPNVHRNSGLSQFPYGAGLQIGCLTSVPYPVWYYLKIDNDGDLVFAINQAYNFDANGNPIDAPRGQSNLYDVDYIAFGPFNSLQQSCSEAVLGPCPPGVRCGNNTDFGNNYYPAGNIVDCSYDGARSETLTIRNAKRGQIYAILITNFSGNPGYIQLKQTNIGQNGAGSTDCKFLCEVDLGKDQYLCPDVEEYTIEAKMSSAGSLTGVKYTWFKDGEELFTIVDNGKLVVRESGTYKVRVEKDLCEENPEDEIYIKFYEEIELKIPGLIELCDFENKGYEFFKLNELIDEAIANDAEPETLEYAYYASLNDASTNKNPLIVDDLYKTSGETIYVKVNRDKNMKCAVIYGIKLVVKATAYYNAEFSYETPICLNNVEELPIIPGPDFTPGGSFEYLTISQIEPIDSPKKDNKKESKEKEGLVLNKVTGTINVGASIPGVYEVFYRRRVPGDMCGEDVEHAVTITIFDRFAIDFDGDCVDGKYNLKVIDLLGNINLDNAKYSWRGPSGFTGDTKVVYINEQGIYTVYFETEDGCTEEISIEIDDANCLIPKGISPNGDGRNDYFDLINYKVKSFKVFNRNGREVYSHGLGYTREWMGQDKSGNKLPSGTYYYVIVSNGKMRTGWVQINY